MHYNLETGLENVLFILYKFIKIIFTIQCNKKIDYCTHKNTCQERFASADSFVWNSANYS